MLQKILFTHIFCQFSETEISQYNKQFHTATYNICLLLDDVPKSEYPVGSLYFNCSAVILGNYPIFWQICTGEDIKNLCERTANLVAYHTDIQLIDFKGRVSYVDPGTIKVTNMMKTDNGVVSCWRPKGATRKYLYEANFIGITYKHYN